MLFRREGNCLKTSEQIISVIYLYVILFRMHEKDNSYRERF